MELPPDAVGTCFGRSRRDRARRQAMGYRPCPCGAMYCVLRVTTMPVRKPTFL